MHRYETLYIQHPERTEAQVRETNERVRRLIEGMGGQVTEVQEWGLRDLAYPIRKLARGHYTLALYTAQPEVVRELERTMKIADEVLRFVSVRVQEPKRSAKRPTPRTRTASVPEAEPVPSPEQGG